MEYITSQNRQQLSFGNMEDSIEKKAAVLKIFQDEKETVNQ
jgi:hypothetical protein